MTTTIHLQAIDNLKTERLNEDIDNFALKYSKNNFCGCYTKRIDDIENLMVCNHLSKAIKNKFGKRIDWIFNFSIKNKIIKILKKENGP